VLNAGDGGEEIAALLASGEFVNGVDVSNATGSYLPSFLR
jgi:hypothetical protein